MFSLKSQLDYDTLGVREEREEDVPIIKTQTPQVEQWWHRSGLTALHFLHHLIPPELPFTVRVDNDAGLELGAEGL